jgi:alcohol dehydrogenase (NADP+)
MRTIGYAAYDARSPLAPLTFERRDLRDDDVSIELMYCGICHTDLHVAHDTWKEWFPTSYPLVLGHEMVGRVTAIGASVSRHAVGDFVAVGTMIDSCQHCDQCRRNQEQMCRKGATLTYGARDRIDGTLTQGGFSKHIIVRDTFALKLPAGLDPARAAPLLCAGITVYSPLRQYGVGPGSRVAVVGIGGLGHLAVRFAAALGADVTVITRTADKAAEAKALGADRVVLSTSDEAMASAASSFDVIIDTIPSQHDVSPYVALLDIEGTLVIVGQLGAIDGFSSLPLLTGRRRITGSPAGGLAETQEMLDFCGRKQVLPDCEIVPIDDVNLAFERLERGDVRYRFVLDLASLSLD